MGILLSGTRSFSGRGGRGGPRPLPSALLAFALCALVFLFALFSAPSDDTGFARPTEPPPERAVTISPEAARTLAFLASKRPSIPGMPDSPPFQGSDFYLSGLYGWRVNPITGEGREFHSGLDFAAVKGTLVIVPAPGIVKESFSDPYIGEAVRVDHGSGVETLYGHLDRRFVATGERLTKGEAIGRVGYTGRSTGSHLHYAVFKDGAPVDPLPFLWEALGSRFAMR